MASQVIEGTTEEISALLQGGAFAGRKLRVIVDPVADDISQELPNPPNSIRDLAHLEELLLEGLASPKQEVTSETWDQVHRQVREHHAARIRKARA